MYMERKEQTLYQENTKEKLLKTFNKFVKGEPIDSLHFIALEDYIHRRRAYLTFVAEGNDHAKENTQKINTIVQVINQRMKNPDYAHAYQDAILLGKSIHTILKGDTQLKKMEGHSVQVTEVSYLERLKDEYRDDNRDASPTA
jgi:hypothetical protein